MSDVKEYSASAKTKDKCMINCTSLKSPKCPKRLEAGVQGIRENMKKNGGKYICRECSLAIRVDKNIEIRAVKKQEFVDPKLADILESREIKPLSGEVKICPAKNHEICARNCVPKYPYSKDNVPIEDFHDHNNPEKPFNLCLGCRTYATQCRSIVNAKRETSSNMVGCKTCLSNCHGVASIMPRENIPIKYFLQELDDPNSKVCQNCIDCRNYIKNNENARISKYIENGDLYCAQCKVKKNIEEMGINVDGTTTKCKQCKKIEEDNSVKRYNGLMKHYRQLQLDRIIEQECSCMICKCIFIKPDEGKFICMKLRTRIENELNVVDYEGKTYIVKEFLFEYSDLLEYRVLDFDHLPTVDTSIDKLYVVSRAATKEKMTIESLKCQLLDCECHLKETIKREKGLTIRTGEFLRKREYVNNLKRSGCLFCGYMAETDGMLRFIHMDHIDPTLKTLELSKMVNDHNYSIKDLQEESSKCRPLCAFCHRILTFYYYGNSYTEEHESIIPGPVEFSLET